MVTASRAMIVHDGFASPIGFHDGSGPIGRASKAKVSNTHGNHAPNLLNSELHQPNIIR